MKSWPKCIARVALQKNILTIHLSQIFLWDLAGYELAKVFPVLYH